MKISRRISLAALAFSALSATVLAQTPSPSPQQEKQIVSSNNAFACDLYAQLRDTKGNLFFSPFSVSTALAMTSAGAKADTAAQMRKALRFPASQDDVHAGFAGLLRRLDEVNRGGSVQLNMANSLWPQTGAPIHESFLALVKQSYGVEITPVDYKHAEPEARAQINRWVEEKTQDKINDLISRPLSEDARLVLVNAVYFKGDWEHAFDAVLTKDESFFSGDGRVVQTPLMQQTNQFNYAELNNSQLIELPYKSGALSMFVVLPKDKTSASLTKLENGLAGKQIAAWKAQMRETEVQVFLPKFRLEWGTASLTQALKNLGMNNAFVSGKADFSGISGDKFFIGDVLQKAFVAVDEEGTEAAAATAVTMAAGAAPGPVAPPPVFRADHPFMFFIHDNATGSILFMGRVVKLAADQ